MKYWKNITIELPKINLEEVSDKLMELDIIAVVIKDKRNINDSDWFHKNTEPVKYDSETHSVSLTVEGNLDNKALLKKVVHILKLNKIPKYSEEKFQDQDWELYNLSEDRTELNDLSSKEKKRVEEMAIEWEEWAKISNVLPWPVNPNVLAKRLEGDHAHIHQHRGPTAGQIADGKGKFL